MTEPQRPRVREDLAVVELDGEAVIYDPETGDLHHLNPAATLVFSFCDGQTSARRAAEEIAMAANQPVADVAPQVRRFLRQLKRARLVTTNEGARG